MVRVILKASCSKLMATALVTTLVFGGLGAYRVDLMSAYADSSLMASASATANSDFNGDGFDDLAIGAPLDGIGSYPDAGTVNVIYGSSGGLRAGASGSTPDDQLWHENVAGVESSPLTNGGFGEVLAAGDFNDDGYGDLAVSVPEKKIKVSGSGFNGAGAVHVLYGSQTGLQVATPADQFWHQNSPGVKDESMNFDLFGKSLAVGDFNGDGIDDLAVGIPGEDDDGDSSIGAVQILFGSATGLQADLPDDQFIPAPTEVCLQSAQADIGIQTDETGPCDHRNFGRSVSAGDYNGDGYSDLAVSQPHAVQSNRAIFVYMGSENGVASVPALDYAVPTGASALTSGDFDGNAFDDLAIGLLNEQVSGINGAGAVSVLYGSSSGLSTDSPDNQQWNQNSPGVAGDSEQDDRFGASLNAADYNNDGFIDLAIGVLGESLGSATEAGSINVLYGSSDGLQAESPNDQGIHQNTSGVLDNAESGDMFASTLSSGDFNNDGKSDLVVGVPFEDIGSISNAGAVHVFYGSSSGLRTSSATGIPDDQFWSQNSSSVKDASETEDRFGSGI